MTVGIVIPAYRGAGVLDRSMRSIAAQQYDGPMEVVVAVNDGRADTLAAAHRLARGQSRGRPVHRRRHRRRPIGRVQRGGVAPAPGPRVYVDQDAVLPSTAVAALVAALDEDRPLFAAPMFSIAPSRSRISRAYYRAWAGLPYVRSSPVTIGVFAVSRAGREAGAPSPRCTPTTSSCGCTSGRRSDGSSTRRTRCWCPTGRGPW